ncbi:MAG: bifunctional transaldolase/phosoglucose isomerase [Elusimicrobia bacterium]|nr:bifunctional transaldolase/phosoglucose isomerase [Elusimicrobiota bacterium]
MLTPEDIRRTGQSLWLDDLSRQLLFGDPVTQPGALSRLIRNRAVTGLTSNPSIFEKALAGEYYSGPIRRLAASGASAVEIYELLAVEDIQRASDLLRPAYEASGGLDGFVSMEVSPKLAFDAARTEAEGLRLAARVGRPNLMIKVPATKEGLLAGENLLKKGVSVNFTLVFTVNRYGAVTQAYTHAMSWRLKHSLPVAGLASVASFFVSRIDTAVDSRLRALPPGPAGKLAGRAAVENSLLAYRLYRDLFYCPGFRASGIPPQRILWASTSVKDPAYRPSLYMEQLALEGSVNTAPEEALEAYFSGGEINRGPLAPRFAAAEAYFAELKKSGLDFGAILECLEKDGIEKFARSHDGLLARIEKERAAAGPEVTMPQEELSEIDAADALDRLAAMNFAGRLWKKDPGLWKKDEANAKQISGALGWLDSPSGMLPKIKEIEEFSEEIRAAGFTHAVLLGMGGSSLAPEVLRGVFQNPKYPRLLVLDTTDPAWIESVQKQLDLKRALFIFASKSGGTIEPSSHFKYFWSLVKKAGVKDPGGNFMAVTDPGTGLEKLAKAKKFRRVFLNPPDIGGRFSALSYFGLVPAALCGADIGKLLGRAVNMAALCREPEVRKNPGALLGALMGSLALRGRDKLTLLLPGKLKYFGLWVEQLVAESTGKEGKGIIPVCLEPLMEPDKYQADRFFVHVKLEGFTSAAEEAALAALKKAGHPVYAITLKDPYDLGAEFFRWEAATAAAGALLEINPFDQPDVQEAKLLTMRVLARYAEKGKRPAPKPDFSADRVSVFASRALRGADKTIASYDDVFWSVFSALGEKEYIGLLAYLPSSPKVEAGLARLRESLTRYTSSACTLAYGPRYLHSSGQLHKGGPDSAFFLILTSQAKKDILVPGEKYSFWQLETAQALGDFEALDSKNRRVLRLHLKHPLDKSLAYLSERIARIGKPGNGPAAATAEESEMLKLTAKKNARTTAAKTKPVDAAEYVVVDYPKNLENITARHYAVRIGASDCTGMDISVNDQPWQTCRHAVGYWWFDWNELQPGTHQLVARMHKRNGEYLISKRRRCKVS